MTSENKSVDELAKDMYPIDSEDVFYQQERDLDWMYDDYTSFYYNLRAAFKAGFLAASPKGKEEENTVGQILTGAIRLHELHPDVVEEIIDLPKGILVKLLNDDYYTNSVPVVLFKNLLLSLHIPFTKIEPAMIPTFRLVLSKETPETIKKKPQGYMLWENEESVYKYTKHLKDIMTPPPQPKDTSGMQTDVLNFIYTIRESFIGADKVYTLGSCYQFYRILKLIFPLANAYYNSDHVITEIDGKYYDITGEVEKTNHLLMDEHYPQSTVMQNRYNALLSTQQGEDATG